LIVSALRQLHLVSSAATHQASSRPPSFDKNTTPLSTRHSSLCPAAILSVTAQDVVRHIVGGKMA
jgi:hypothetical protein